MNVMTMTNTEISIKKSTMIDNMTVSKAFRMFRFAGAIIFSGLFVLATVQPAHAQDVQALLDKIERMERDIRGLYISISRTGVKLPKLSSEQAGEGDGDGSVTARLDQSPPSSAISNAAVARIDARISALEGDVRVATGTMEEIDHRIFTISAQLDKIIVDMEYRLGTLERVQANPAVNSASPSGSDVSANALSGDMQITAVPPVGSVTPLVGQTSSGVLGTISETQLQDITTQAIAVETQQSDVQQQQSASESPVQETAATVSQVPLIPQADQVQVQTQPLAATQDTAQTAALSAPTEATAQQDYMHALGLMRQAKNAEAATELEQFIMKHDGDPLVANARYWLGETYYVRSQFVEAAEVFYDGYKANPNGVKAPDTLLKLGMSLSNLGKKPQACAAFAKLTNDFSDVSSKIRTALTRERVRNDCS